MTKNIRQELIAGLTTFLTMSYIVIVNPAILATEGTGMSFQGVMTATVLLSIVCTLMMGLYAKLPYAVAPGMGINAFFTYSLVLGQKIPWQTALGMVFWSGVLFLILSTTPIREQIVKAMPKNLRHGAAVGIGIFLTFIGFKNAEIIKGHPVTLVTMGSLGLNTVFVILGLFVIAWFMRKKNPLAFLMGIGLVALLCAVTGQIKLPNEMVSLPDFTSVFMQLDFMGSLKLAFLPAIISILFTDLFDSISTFMGLSQAANLLDEKGEPKNIREGLIVDSYATAFAGLFGTSSGTAYIESAAGIEAGGRTGLTAVFTALFFIPCLFIGPLVQMIPAVATAPVLIFVGFLMFRSVKELSTSTIEEALPAFLTVILIPLTFSITQGILWGLVAHVVLFVIAGRAKELSRMMYALGLLSVFLIYLQGH